MGMVGGFATRGGGAVEGGAREKTVGVEEAPAAAVSLLFLSLRVVRRERRKAIIMACWGE